MRLPENYAGNAISQNDKISVNTADIKRPTPIPETPSSHERIEKAEEKNPWETEEKSPTEEEVAASATPTSLFGGLFEKLSLPSVFGGRRPFDNGWMSRIGIEEIMLIAVAALLFFSKNGDKECALILLLLLFVDAKD